MSLTPKQVRSSDAAREAADRLDQALNRYVPDWERHALKGDLALLRNWVYLHFRDLERR